MMVYSQWVVLVKMAVQRKGNDQSDIKLSMQDESSLTILIKQNNNNFFFILKL
jgi:hypothetical protein